MGIAKLGLPRTLVSTGAPLSIRAATPRCDPHTRIRTGEAVLMPTRDQVQSLLLECIREYSEQAGRKLTVTDDAPLIGPGAAVDSLGLVMLVTGFEAKLNETYDTQLVLASESAMSMNRSPFRSVAALTDYAVELLGEAERAQHP
jgi:acyl carrier protein